MTDSNTATKDNLKVQALTQRIAQLVAQYEEQLADFRADATLQIQSMGQTISELQRQLEERDSNVQVEETASDEQG